MRTMKPFVDWLKTVMGWEQFWQIEFHTAQLEAGKTKESGSGLKSIVMWDPKSQVKIASNEPLRPFFRASQIERFVEDNRGPGVQHIALDVPSAIDAVQELKKVGLKFLDAPATYYERLPARFKEVGFDIARVKEPLKEIQANNLLVDGSKDGYMLQIFTDELRVVSGNSGGAPAFYEVIQRAGDRGFGYGNFRALFEAIEALQTSR
jgi:4-hydroxyphenylpyruvate dioxygenase